MIKNQNKIDIKAIVRKCGLVRESIIHPDTLSEQEWHKIIGILAQAKQSDKFIPYSPFTRLLADTAGKFKQQDSYNIHTECTPDTCENCSREFRNKTGLGEDKR